MLDAGKGVVRNGTAQHGDTSPSVAAQFEPPERTDPGARQQAVPSPRCAQRYRKVQGLGMIKV